MFKIDLGCGKNKQKDHIGLDIVKAKGVDIICDLSNSIPLRDNIVDNIFSSHFIEHIPDKCYHTLLNEIVRVGKDGAEVIFRVPFWNSEVALFNGHVKSFPPEFFKQLDQYRDVWFTSKGYLKLIHIYPNYTKEGLEFCRKLGISPEEGAKFLNNIVYDMDVYMGVVK